MRGLADRHLRRDGILMYHRVAAQPTDPWGLCVSPARFEEQIAALARHDSATDLGTMRSNRSLARGAGPQIAVTFDDAYIDNFTDALPALEKHGVPATIFVIPGALGRKREFWWDALVRALLESGPLPAELRLRLGGQERIFAVEEAAGDFAPSDWRADDMEPRTPRERLYLDLWNAIVKLELSEQDETVDEILAWAGMSLAPPVDRLPATADHVARLAQHPLVRVGSHTADHVSLPDCSPAKQRAQIDGGHRALEAIVGRRVDRFSYPFGRWDETARRHVRDLGVDVACTSVARAVTPWTSRLALPRLQVTDMDGDSFVEWLRDEHRLPLGSSVH